MATIYYCKVCEKLLVDEDDLPTVGNYCSKRCEKLAEKHGVAGAKKEHKKKDERPMSFPTNQPGRELPAEFPAENTPRLRKKKSINNDDNNYNQPARNKIFSFFGGKNNNNSNSDNDSSSDDAKNKKRIGRNHSNDKSKDYDDALEYFRKRSDIPNNIKRDDTKTSNNTRTKRKKEPRPASTPTPTVTPTVTTTTSTNNNNNISSNANIPPHREVIPEEIPTPPVNNPVNNSSVTDQPLYPNLKPNPLEDILLSEEPSEPPPSYSEIFPDSSNQTEVNDIKDKSLPEPPLPPRRTDEKKKFIMKDYNKPELPPKPPIPPKLPPKIPIKSRNLQQMQSQHQQHFGDTSNQFSSFHASDQFANFHASDQFANFHASDQFANFHGSNQFANFHGSNQFASFHGSNQYSMIHQHPHNNTPSDTYLQEQALPTILYPPIDYDKYTPPTNNHS